MHRLTQADAHELDLTALSRDALIDLARRCCWQAARGAPSDWTAEHTRLIGEINRLAILHAVREQMLSQELTPPSSVPAPPSPGHDALPAGLGARSLRKPAAAPVRAGLPARFIRQERIRRRTRVG